MGLLKLGNEAGIINEPLAKDEVNSLPSSYKTSMHGSALNS